MIDFKCPFKNLACLYCQYKSFGWPCHFVELPKETQEQVIASYLASHKSNKSESNSLVTSQSVTSKNVVPNGICSQAQSNSKKGMQP